MRLFRVALLAWFATALAATSWAGSSAGAASASGRPAAPRAGKSTGKRAAAAPAATKRKSRASKRGASKRKGRHGRTSKRSTAQPRRRAHTAKRGGTKRHGRHHRRRPRPKPRVPGSKPGKPDAAVRQILTGQHPEHYTAEPFESAELRAIRQLDRELFPPKAAPSSAPWQQALELPSPGPAVNASGLPPAHSGAPAPGGAKQARPTWLATLTRPDIRVRFDPSVVRYLRYYKDNPRGRALLATWVKRSGRYRQAISRLLRAHRLPQSLLWVALVESAFSPKAYSPAGAAGLWQFMPNTGRIYGLTVTRRVDERLDPERSTQAALRHLSDLHQRFGTWELALAAYNMGYGGLLASIRRFNTNDYWELRRLEAGLPYETALYVPKIMAVAVAAANCKVFGCDKVEPDAPLPFGSHGADVVSVAPGVTLDEIAKAAGRPVAAIAALNPQVIGSHLPPVEQASTATKSWRVYLPKGSGKRAAARLPRGTRPRSLSTHRVRWGEHLSHIAAAYRTSEGYLRKLNDLYAYESPRPTSTIFVPPGRTPKPDGELRASGADRPLGVVPDQPFAYPERRRVFYAPVLGDTVADVARVCGVTAAELRRWNHLDAGAKLQRGMRLQLFIPKTARPAGVRLEEEAAVRVLTAGSPEFFSHFVSRRGRTRLEITAAAGDTWRKLGKRYGLSLALLERINGRSRRSTLAPGDRVVVYASRVPQPPRPAPPPPTDAAPTGSPPPAAPGETPPDGAPHGPGTHASTSTTTSAAGAR